MMRVAVIGAGPGGAYCASLLAGKGFGVSLFDFHAAWEKPCGGGVTFKAIQRYPFLRQALQPHRAIQAIEVLSPSDQRVTIPLTSPLSIYSRNVLNQIILDQAVSQGVNFHQERVLTFSKHGSQWQIQTDRAAYEVDYLVGADGVNSFVRKRLGKKFEAEDLMMTFGYRLPGVMDDRIIIKFYPKFHGYLWAFPRPEHVSLGICARLHRYGMKELKTHLHEFMRKSFTSKDFQAEEGTIYSSLIPSLRPESLRENRICGEGWALVGDAAGFCDPITCEGIYFALRSGELLAETLAEGDKQLYVRSCSQEFVGDFICGANLFEKFYAGQIMGRDFITRMVQWSRKSKILCATMNAFVAGKQNYRTLKYSLLRKSPLILLELLLGT
ncbi:MAG: NAD(P)/FAD-dependent oxidoreductase [Terriglobia bacterium]